MRPRIPPAGVDPIREIPPPISRDWTWQRSRILLVGIAAITLIVAFPPWNYVGMDGMVLRCIDGGRAWIFMYPKPDLEIMNGIDVRNATPGVDLIRLGLQVAVVALATVFALTLRSRYKP